MRELADRFGTALRGVLLQPMAARGRELLVGVHSDGVFGPLVVFGLGGGDTVPVLDIGAARDVLLRVSLLAQLLPEVIELDLNPLTPGSG